MIFRCAHPVSGCGRTFLTAEARQHHIYHSHQMRRPKDDHSGEIDMALYLGLETTRGVIYWSRRIRKVFRNR